LTYTQNVIADYEQSFKIGKYALLVGGFLVLLGLRWLPLILAGLFIGYLGYGLRKDGEEKRDQMLEIQHNAKLSGEASSPVQMVQRETITREIVLVTCRYCGYRSVQGTLKCANCGGSL
jgi:hypothetical protein